MKIEGEKRFLLEERKKLIFGLLYKGFNQADIARIFNFNRSNVTVMMKMFHKEYQEFVKNQGK